MSAPQSPRRWIEEGGSATPFERDLLRSALSVDPPPDAQKQVWAGVLAALPPLPPPPPAGPGHVPGHAPNGGGAGGKLVASKAAAAGKAALAGKAVGSGAVAAASAGILKSALLGAGSAVALLATYSVVTPSAPVDPAPAALVVPYATTAAPVAPARGGAGARGRASPDEPSPAAAPAEPGAPAAPIVATGPEHRVEARPSVSAPASAPVVPVEAAERETMLREENRQVSEARDALRRGDSAGALGQLEQIRVRFPGGVLVQEREALTIEALARSGRRADASARGAAFLHAYPTSMLSERVRVFTMGAPAPVPGSPASPATNPAANPAANPQSGPQ